MSSTAGEVETTSAQMCEDNDGTDDDASEVETTSAIMNSRVRQFGNFLKT